MFGNIEATTYEERLIDAFEDLKFDFQYVIRAALRSRKMTAKKLAAEMGVSASQVSQLLSDDANPTLETLAKALAALEENVGVVSNTLFGEAIVRAARRCEVLYDEETAKTMSYDHASRRQFEFSSNQGDDLYNVFISKTPTPSFANGGAYTNDNTHMLPMVEGQAA